MPSRSFPEEHTYPSVIYDDRFSLPPQSSPQKPLTEIDPNSILTFLYDELKRQDEFVSRTTIKKAPDRTPDPPHKTTDLNFIDDNYDMLRFKTPKIKNDKPAPANVERPSSIEELQMKPEESPGKDQEIVEKEDKFLQHKDTTVLEKEMDINYNNFFYNDDYKEVTTRKQLETSVHYMPDEYDDKPKDKEVNLVSVTDKIEGPEQNDYIKQSSTEKDVVFRYNQELETEALRRASTKNISINIDISTVKATFSKPVILTTQSDTEVIKVEKKGPICSMLKLRQLNFNSPRTLPEVILQFFKPPCKIICFSYLYCLVIVHTKVHKYTSCLVCNVIQLRSCFDSVLSAN